MSNNKSYISKLAEIILNFTKPDYMDDKKAINDLINTRLKQTDKPPKSIFKSTNISGVDVFTFGDDDLNTVILYIHGGAYINEINLQHLLFCCKLSKKSNTHIIAPVYPLAPKHNVCETFELILKLYKDLVGKYSKIILMGDSAGGGFALSFSQYLNKNNLNEIDKIIVFSPWVDVSMSNPPYDSDNDPILGEVGLKEIGCVWAGNLSNKDYKVSPLFGEISNHPKTLIFAGENEIFYSDICKYVNKLNQHDIDVKLITGYDLFHIYPLFPIPEAKSAFQDIVEEIDK